MTDRLLQDETQTHDSKGLSRWQKLAAAGHTRRPTWRALPPDEEITEAQIEAQDSMWGVLQKEKP